MRTYNRLLAFASVVAFAIAAALFSAAYPERDRLGDPRFAERAGLLYYKDAPFTGTAIDRYPDGRIAVEAPYRDGRREGEVREFAHTGARKAIWRYRDGKKHGLQEGWHLEGPKKFEQNYRDGVLEGLLTEWHLNGRVFNQQTYENGVETARKVLFPESEIYSNYVKRDGRTFGQDGGSLCFETKREGER